MPFAVCALAAKIGYIGLKRFVPLIAIAVVAGAAAVATARHVIPVDTVSEAVKSEIRAVTGLDPVLRGPVSIFGDGEFVAVGEIQTTGPGGEIELPLGADANVRIERTVVPNTKTTGLILKSDETSYDVVVQVANYKKQKVTIEIVDQIPRSKSDKIEVKLLGAQPAAVGASDADGVVRWRLQLAPGATQTVKLSYRISRPRNWQLNQY